MGDGTDSKKTRISIDRGGTFTDVIAIVPGHDDIVLKLLSVDPDNYEDAPTEGIRRILEITEEKDIPRGEKLNIESVQSIRMGTTLATNALLERKGEKTALVTTKGFKDLLRIGNQSRPKIFDLSCAKPDVLFEKVVEIDERVTLEGFAEDPEKSKIDVDGAANLVKGVTGEVVRIVKKIDMREVEGKLKEIQDGGFKSIAIVLAHAYTYQDHELEILKMAEGMGFSCSASSQLMPMVKMVPRGTSATADAYLTPKIKGYLESFGKAFQGGLDDNSTTFEFMQSDGGMVNFDRFSGLKAILSGPAGGVVGFAQTSYQEGGKAVIGFDVSLGCDLARCLIKGSDGWYLDGRFQICRSVRACFRDDYSWGHNPKPSTRHQYSCCRWWFNAILSKWFICGRAGIRISSSGTGMLS